MNLKKEEKEKRMMPDSLECGLCGAEIIHDDYVYVLDKCYNMHGTPFQFPEEDSTYLCRDCFDERFDI